MERDRFTTATSMHANIRLREVEPDDLPAFFLHQRDSEAVAMAAFTSRDAPAFELHWAKILADETGLKKTIVVVSAEFATPDTVAGNIVSWNSDAKREVGYWIERVLGARRCDCGALRIPWSGTDARALRRRGEAQRSLTSCPAEVRIQTSPFREAGMRRHRQDAPSAGAPRRGFNLKTRKPERA